jgi:hypothetical protein
MGATVRPRDNPRSGSNGSPAFPDDSTSPAHEEKQAAVQRVLRSAAFLRAEQLRNFLRYVCEMELAGRAAELSEYLIGIEALGRPPGYSTADDSSVRRQAHALRQKLEEVYAGELAGAVVRVDLPKGSYVPRFVLVPAANLETRAATPAAEQARIPSADDRRPASGPRMPALLAAGFAVGAMATLGVLWTAGLVSRSGPVPSTVAPVLGQAWGPLARPGANVLICLATPPHLVVLPYPPGPLPPLASLLPPLTGEPSFREWYRLHYPLEPTHSLGVHKTSGPIHLGDVNGLVAAVRTLDRMGVEFQIVAEKNMGLPALRGRNLMFLGNPEYSFAAAKLLDSAVWTVAYDPAQRQRVVKPRDPATRDAPVYSPTRDSQGWLLDVYGLITVLPSAGASETKPDPARTVILSCSNDSGCQAAMEFFASATHMRKLLERFQKQQNAGFPPSYQVVVRCRVQSGQTISVDYADHVVLG